MVVLACAWMNSDDNIEDIPFFFKYNIEDIQSLLIIIQQKKSLVVQYWQSGSTGGRYILTVENGQYYFTYSTNAFGRSAAIGLKSVTFYLRWKALNLSLIYLKAGNRNTMKWARTERRSGQGLK
jgi:hypothetical protein